MEWKKAKVGCYWHDAADEFHISTVSVYHGNQLHKSYYQLNQGYKTIGEYFNLASAQSAADQIVAERSTA